MVWNIFVPEKWNEMNFLDFLVLIVGNNDEQYPEVNFGGCVVPIIIILIVLFFVLK